MMATRTVSSLAATKSPIYFDLTGRAKLGLVVVMTLFHFWLAARARRFLHDANRTSARTYRVLGLPTIGTLFRTHHPLPTAVALRSALSPGIAYALVGIESLVLFAVLVNAGPNGNAALFAVLAALGPVIRAGFEWAQLLYFDLVRLDVPLLRGLRRRFDTAIARLAAIMGVGTWALAATLGASLLGVRDGTLLFLLLLFFVLRSLLASAQVRMFSAGAYWRLSAVGALGGIGSLVALAVVTTEAGRLVALSVVLAISFAALLVLPVPVDPADRVLALPDWLARLRCFPGPVALTRVVFDKRTLARGVVMEERRKEEWRRRLVARKIGSMAAQRGGAATWLGPFELAWFGAVGDASPINWIGSGLVVKRPVIVRFATGVIAAKELLSSTLGPSQSPGLSGVQSLVSEFERTFPGGIVYQSDLPAPPQLAAMSSPERAEILRGALRFARDALPSNEPFRWDVTAIADAGRLRVVFIIDRRQGKGSRRLWAERVRAWMLTAAALRQPHDS